jgi:hypothetical protein
MKWFLLLCVAAIVILPLFTGCDDDGDSADGDSDTDTDGDSDSDSDADTGSVEVTGNWDGSAPEGSDLRVSLFDCPFTMPPDYFFEGTWDAETGDVWATQEGVEPGEWCLMAYIDIDDGDGLAPMEGLDPVNATGDENPNGAIPIAVEAGKTTTVELVFEI